MKKISFALALIIGSMYLAPVTTAQSVCTQVVTAAVNYRGECQLFANPCQVPSDWKTLPTSSCEAVSTKEGISLETRAEQRRQQFFRAKPAENKQLESKIYEQPAHMSYGTGALTRGNVNRSGSMQERNTRKFTNRYGRSSQNTKTAGTGRTSALRTGTYKRMARAAGLSRTGAFESKPKWSTQQQRHSKSVPTDFDNRPWESETQIRVKAQIEKKRAQREKYLESMDGDRMDVLTRGGYRESSTGDLDNYTERTE